MIDRLSSHWKEACELIDYTYPEDLESWKYPDDGSIDISLPVLDKLSPGDVVYMNNINYSYMFLFSMLRPAILDYTPLVMLSCNEESHIFQNRMLLSFLSGEFKSDEKVTDRLSAGAILSKRLRAKRFCEVEDELEVLSSKGFRVVILSYDSGFPYLDAESREKGYESHSDALIETAKRTGLVIFVLWFEVPLSCKGATCLYVTPVKRMFLPPTGAIVMKDNSTKSEFRFSSSNRDDWHFSKA